MGDLNIPGAPTATHDHPSIKSMDNEFPAHGDADTLENRLRGLILNTVPQPQGSVLFTPTVSIDNQNHHGASPADQSGEDTLNDRPAISQVLPPHMKAASVNAQREYLAKVDQSVTQTAPAQPNKPSEASSTPRKKLNQAQRRQMKTQLEIPVTPPANSRRTQPPRSERAQQSWRGPTPVGQRQSPRPDSFQPQVQTAQAQPDRGSYARPIPQNRQLYRPTSHNQFNRRPPLTFQHRSWEDLNAQAYFLNEMARVEVGIVEVGIQELEERDVFRSFLEDACRNVIGDYEEAKSNMKSFDRSSISLKCFGSLSSGFATKSSDMDLALLSPLSVPEASTIESEIPRLLEKRLLDMGYGARLLTRTRVPIIKLCEEPTTELLAALRAERLKWEETKDKVPMAEEDVNGFDAENGLNAEDDKESMKSDDKKEGDPVARDLRRLNQRSHENLFAYYRRAKNLLDSQGGRDYTSPQHRALEPEEGQFLNSMSKAYVLGLHNRELKTRLLGYRSLKFEAGFRSLAGVWKQAEGELLAMSWEDGKRKITLEDTEKTWFDSDIGEKTDEAQVIPEAWKKTEIDEAQIVQDWLKLQDQDCSDILSFNDAVHKLWVTLKRLSSSKLVTQMLDQQKDRARDRPRYEDKLDFPKTGVGIQCDINFSNLLALHNTHLLRCYSHCDARVKPMVLFIKAWAKRRKINSPYHGTLSSYGYVLMVLHYLVNIASPPVVPNLQLSWRPPPHGSWGAALENETMVQGYDVRFWRNEEEIKSLASRGMFTHNKEPVGSLLRSFFEYFARQGSQIIASGFSWSSEILSIRTPGGLLNKQVKGWTGAKTTVTEATTPGQEKKEVRHRYLFAIEDPFEIDHNIARTVTHNGIVAIRDEFRRALKLIDDVTKGVNSGEELLQKIEEKIEGPRDGAIAAAST
ncbi:MAG: hypothetical protein M1827_006008 [Pycnora praestabilis]|nr:MAG: hypothetical protein M1827_006008 [Pycnora praestabilis]